MQLGSLQEPLSNLKSPRQESPKGRVPMHVSAIREPNSYVRLTAPCINPERVLGHAESTQELERLNTFALEAGNVSIVQRRFTHCQYPILATVLKAKIGPSLCNKQFKLLPNASSCVHALKQDAESQNSSTVLDSWQERQSPGVNICNNSHNPSAVKHQKENSP